MRDWLFVQVPDGQHIHAPALSHRRGRRRQQRLARALAVPAERRRVLAVRLECGGRARRAWVYGTGDVYRPQAGGVRPPRAHHAARAHRAHAQRVRILYRACGDCGKFKAVTGTGCNGSLSFVGWAGRPTTTCVSFRRTGCPASTCSRVDRRRGRGRARWGRRTWRALATLTRPSTLALWLETDWPARLTRSRPWRGCARGSARRARRAAAALANATAFPHENAVPPEARHTHRGRATRGVRGQLGRTARSTRG